MFTIIICLMLCTGCAVNISEPVNDPNDSVKEEETISESTVSETLDEKEQALFIDEGAIICEPDRDYQVGLAHPLIKDTPGLHPIAEDFISLDAEAFSQSYQDERSGLFKKGVQYRLARELCDSFYFDLLDMIRFGADCHMPVIGNLYVGDTLEKMISLFGEAHFINQELGLYGYRFPDFYLICHGDANIGEISIVKYQALSDEYNNIIDYYLNQRRHEEYVSISGIAAQYPDYLYSYPGGYGHILLYGNGLLLTSDIIEDDTLLVWNNYQGSIRTDEDNQVIQFIDQDFYFDQISQYYLREKTLKERPDGVSSPDGNIIAYPCNTGRPIEGDEILIRFLDGTHRDINVLTSHMQTDLFWLSDRYLLYQVYFDQPYIYDLYTDQAIPLNQMAELPIDYRFYSSNPEDYGEAYYHLGETNELIWGTEKTGDYFSIKYSFDQNGAISFTYTSPQ